MILTEQMRKLKDKEIKYPGRCIFCSLQVASNRIGLSQLQRRVVLYGFSRVFRS